MLSKLSPTPTAGDQEVNETHTIFYHNYSVIWNVQYEKIVRQKPYSTGFITL